MASWLAHLRRVNAHNVSTFRRAPLAEISGSLGDLGTLLPLMIALAVQGSVHLGSTLVFSGAFNILTGVVYGIPLPVQPMKVQLPLPINNFTSCVNTTKISPHCRLLLQQPYLVEKMHPWKL